MDSELPDKSKETSALEMLQVCVQLVIFFNGSSCILFVIFFNSAGKRILPECPIYTMDMKAMNIMIIVEKSYQLAGSCVGPVWV